MIEVALALWESPFIKTMTVVIIILLIITAVGERNDRKKRLP